MDIDEIRQFTAEMTRKHQAEYSGIAAVGIAPLVAGLIFVGFVALAIMFWNDPEGSRFAAIAAVASLIPLVLAVVFFVAGRRSERQGRAAIHKEASRLAVSAALEHAGIDPFDFWDDGNTPITDPAQAATVAHALRDLLPDAPEEARRYFDGAVPAELRGQFDRSPGG